MSDIKVLVADGQRLVAESLGRALSLEPDLEVVPEFPLRGGAALDLIMRSRPDVVIYDYWMLETNGPAAARALQEWAPEIRVILLSWYHGGTHVQEAMASGAAAFLPKSLGVDQVAEAVRRAHAGDPVVFGAELARLAEELARRSEVAGAGWERLKTLTPRELEVLRLLCLGRPTKQLAVELDISVGTLKNHIHRIMDKTGARSQLEAVQFARYYGIGREPELPGDG